MAAVLPLLSVLEYLNQFFYGFAQALLFIFRFLRIFR